MQNEQKINAYLGFAIKSGKIIWGADEITKKPRKRPLIFLCGDAGETTYKQIQAYAEKTHSPLIIIKDFTLEAILKKNCKAIAITEPNLAKAIIANSEIVCGGDINE